MTTTLYAADVRNADVVRRLDALSERLDEMAEELRAQRALRERYAELVADLADVAGPALATLTDRLQAAEENGWFDFARQTGAVAGTVVSSFDADDVAALGDNVVVILQTLREMTQPEVMAMVRRTALAAQHSDDTYADPPGTLALARRLHDPEVRRGLARTLDLLRTVGVAPTPAQTPEG